MTKLLPAGLLTVLVLICSSFSFHGQYSITGTSSLRAGFVVLRRPGGQDSAVIREGHFAFSGIADSPALAALEVHAPGRQDYTSVPMILEAGHIQVEVRDGHVRLSGTADNTC